MSNTLIRRIVEIFIALFVLGGLITVLRGIASAASGSFGTIGWHVSTDSPERLELVSDGSLEWTDGAIRVGDQSAAHLFDIATSLAVLSLLIIALLALRRFLIALASGEVFTGKTVANLRRVGIALLAICLVSVIDALVLQSVIISNAELPQGILLHPSISSNEGGVANLWLEYDVPLEFFVLGGLALIVAEAFKAGQSYREDSESVV